MLRKLESHDPRYGKLTLSLEELANRLDILQCDKNGGMGIHHIRSIICYLRKGLFSEAQSYATYDSDKNYDYPEIDELLTRQGLIRISAASGKRIRWVFESHGIPYNESEFLRILLGVKY